MSLTASPASLTASPAASPRSLAALPTPSPTSLAASPMSSAAFSLLSVDFAVVVTVVTFEDELPELVVVPFELLSFMSLEQPANKEQHTIKLKIEMSIFFIRSIPFVCEFELCAVSIISLEVRFYSEKKVAFLK